jgi:hypothetical protein
METQFVSHDFSTILLFALNDINSNRSKGWVGTAQEFVWGTCVIILGSDNCSGSLSEALNLHNMCLTTLYMLVMVKNSEIS